MAIVSRVVTFTSAGNDSAGNLIYIVKEYLKNQLGYVVRGSNDGTTAAFDGVDRITSATIAGGASARWIVLEDPGGSFQICLGRGTSNNNQLHFKANPLTNSGPAYSGGTTTTLPTATRERAIWTDTAMFTAGSGTSYRVYMTGQNTAPYGFGMYTKTALGSTLLITGATLGGMAFVPIEQQPTTAGCPYWWFITNGLANSFLHNGDLSTVSVTATVNHGVMQIHDNTGASTAAPVGVACWHMNRYSSANVFPNGAGYLDNKDQTVPILLSTGSGGVFAGVSTFMQWNGTLRNFGDTFNNLTRISVGHVSFPWDGSTIPTI